MKPDIILDVGAEFKDFKRKTFFVTQHDEFVMEMIDLILQHIHSEQEAEANLAEMAAMVKESEMQKQEPLSEEQAEIVSNAVHDFAVVMFQQLRDHGAYETPEDDETGDVEFAYRLSGFTPGTDDIVLSHVSPTDTVG
ncbi:hypothetical protein D3C71_77630 [compost metagenome]